MRIEASSFRTGTTTLISGALERGELAGSFTVRDANRNQAQPYKRETTEHLFSLDLACEDARLNLKDEMEINHVCLSSEGQTK
jgi:hypothetical protein